MADKPKPPTPPPADKPPAGRVFDWQVDNPFCTARGRVVAATPADAERVVQGWLASGLALTPADPGR